MSLSKVEAGLKRYLYTEKEFQRKNAGIKWFAEEEYTKFFHTYVKVKRRKIQQNEI